MLSHLLPSSPCIFKHGTKQTNKLKTHPSRRHPCRKNRFVQVRLPLYPFDGRTRRHHTRCWEAPWQQKFPQRACQFTRSNVFCDIDADNPDWDVGLQRFAVNNCFSFNASACPKIMSFFWLVVGSVVFWIGLFAVAHMHTEFETRSVLPAQKFEASECRSGRSSRMANF